MENKITLRQYFEMIKAELQKNGRDDLVEFVDTRIDLLDKKSANRKPKSESEEDKELREKLVAVLTAEGDTITNYIIKAGLTISTPKATSLLKALVDDGTIIREKNGKTTLYKLA